MGFSSLILLADPKSLEMNSPQLGMIRASLRSGGRLECIKCSEDTFGSKELEKRGGKRCCKGLRTHTQEASCFEIAFEEAGF
jgi:hypothetical protein